MCLQSGFLTQELGRAQRLLRQRGPSLPPWKWQQRPLERLERGLFVHAEHDRLLGWLEVQLSTIRRARGESAVAIHFGQNQVWLVGTCGFRDRPPGSAELGFQRTRSPARSPSWRQLGVEDALRRFPRQRVSTVVAPFHSRPGSEAIARGAVSNAREVLGGFGHLGDGRSFYSSHAEQHEPRTAHEPRRRRGCHKLPHFFPSSASQLQRFDSVGATE